MGLSYRAEKYVAGMRRDPKYILTEDELTGHFRLFGIPVFQYVIETAVKYAGLRLVNERHTFEADFISRADLNSGNVPDVINLKDGAWFFFGTHATAPFWSVMREDGGVGVFDNSREEHTAHVTYSRFEIMIEEFAIQDEMSADMYNSNPPYYDLPDPVAFDQKWRHARVYPEASDDYNAWYQVGSILVQKGTWLDGPHSYVHLYGMDKSACEAFVKDLENKAR